MGITNVVPFILMYIPWVRGGSVPMVERVDGCIIMDEKTSCGVDTYNAVWRVLAVIELIAAEFVVSVLVTTSFPYKLPKFALPVIVDTDNVEFTVR